MSNDIPVKEIDELLDVVADKLPRVFEALRQSVFSPEAGEEMGTAVGSFYKALLDKGVPEAKAAELTSDYVRILRNMPRELKLGEQK